MRASGYGVAIFAATAILVVARGGGSSVFSRLPALLRGSLKRKENSSEEGELYTRHSSGRSERWRTIFSLYSDGADEGRGGEEEEAETGEEKEDEEDEDDATTACEIEILNRTGEVLLLCWVSEEGALHHFYPMHPAGSIEDGSVPLTHVEYSHVGHSFVCLRARQLPAQSGQPMVMNDIDPLAFVFVYRPLLAGQRHFIELDCTSGEGTSVRCTPLDTELIDSSLKKYEKTSMWGFTVNYEPDVFREHGGLRELLEGDLKAVRALLPNSICRKLEKTTPIWLNKSLKYGSRSRPTVGRGACYHPLGGKSWLRKNGMSCLKEGGIEFYTIEDYFSSHGDWGKGGGLLHELCHAFHNKLVPQGFENQEIRDAYNAAMRKALYDCVAVHGRKRQKAYACANPQEFFAELSTAFLWKKDRLTEYNKWWPHNRHQLFLHDPDTFRCLDKIWSQAITSTSP